MISPPARNFLNSSFVNVESLRDIEGEPLLEMHRRGRGPARAGGRQVVRVFNDRGEYVCKLRVSPRARPGVVNGLGIWWRKLGLAGTNVNELTSQRLTDLGARRCSTTAWSKSGPREEEGHPDGAREQWQGWRWRRRLCLSGCANLGYYWQSVDRAPRDHECGPPGRRTGAGAPHPSALRAKLELSQRIRDYAVSELKLPDNPSYRRYADLHRGAAVWNVTAAPVYSLELKTWCFPGDRLRRLPRLLRRGPGARGGQGTRRPRLRGQRLPGHGLFDPGLDELGRRRPAAQHLPGLSRRRAGARAVHELAHQVLYAKNDTTFNESFATAVERLGGTRWLQTQACEAARTEYEAFDRRRRLFRELSRVSRERLKAFYETPGVSPDAKGRRQAPPDGDSSAVTTRR
jgi:hypothetical protein